ncbi:MAG: hypothetical protein GY822_17920 [Deltaproteobacteria bacterium]|nr:hypothetical protein [Deltaproteobacteria bacterium]
MAFADLACSLQTLLDKALLGLARKAKESTGATHLCLAGGVALNAVANAKLRDEAYFESIFVQPAAGDAGGALGAAYLGAIDCGDDVTQHGKMHTSALGVSLDLSRAQQMATHLGLQC